MVSILHLAGMQHDTLRLDAVAVLPLRLTVVGVGVPVVLDPFLRLLHLVIDRTDILQILVRLEFTASLQSGLAPDVPERTANGGSGNQRRSREGAGEDRRRVPQGPAEDGGSQDARLTCSIGNGRRNAQRMEQTTVSVGERRHTCRQRIGTRITYTVTALHSLQLCHRGHAMSSAVVPSVLTDR
jgi:hypothetical protein